MGAVKSHYHDEICLNEEFADPFTPFPLPPVHVLMEHNLVSGKVQPIQVYTDLGDAQADLSILNLGRHTFACSQDLLYFLVETVPCIG